MEGTGYLCGHDSFLHLSLGSGDYLRSPGLCSKCLPDSPPCQLQFKFLMFYTEICEDRSRGIFLIDIPQLEAKVHIAKTKHSTKSN